jgi:uncharacterized protein with NRDE domain
MVKAWLTGPTEENTVDFVHRLLDGEGVKGVGGFSLICGKLRKHVDESRKALEPLAIISNRCEDTQDVPWIAGQRNEVYGLSNQSYMDPVTWPKIASGKKLLMATVNDAIAEGWDEEQLVEKLYSVLSTDTLPAQDGKSFEESLSQLRKSIFIPSIGGTEAVKPLLKAEDIAAAGEAVPQPLTNGHKPQNGSLKEELKHKGRPDSGTNGVMTGSYGTQRQTIILVDWNGNVTFRERALWDDHGNPVPKGKGDMKYKFKIDGW